VVCLAGEQLSIGEPAPPGAAAGQELTDAVLGCSTGG
jgi:hypothetical protein